jgi:hypothetical protein
MGEEWERFDTKPRLTLTIVRHITHLPVARRILEDGKIKAGLVYDKARFMGQSNSNLTGRSWSRGSASTG